MPNRNRPAERAEQLDRIRRAEWESRRSEEQIEHWRSTVGEAIEARRFELGWDSATSAAQAAGIGPTTWHAYERGYRTDANGDQVIPSPRMTTQAAACHLLGWRSSAFEDLLAGADPADVVIGKGRRPGEPLFTDDDDDVGRIWNLVGSTRSERQPEKTILLGQAVELLTQMEPAVLAHCVEVIRSIRNETGRPIRRGDLDGASIDQALERLQALVDRISALPEGESLQVSIVNDGETDEEPRIG